VAEFAAGLADAKESTEEGLLKLKEGNSFMGIPAEGNELYIRPCYDALEGVIEEHFQTGGQAAAVMGNPGKRCCH
jgi:hypothetical protein